MKKEHTTKTKYKHARMYEKQICILYIHMLTCVRVTVDDN